MDMLSDISFGIVQPLQDSIVPKDKLPYAPGITDVPSMRLRCENGQQYQIHLFKVWKKVRGGQRVFVFQKLNKEF